MHYAIFDMDGLLIDSEPVWREAQCALMLELHGVALSEADWRSYQGRSSREFCLGMARLHADRGIEAEVLLERLLERMRYRIADAPLMPGARELIDWLAARRMPMAIASSSPPAFIDAVVERHALPIRVLASGTEVPRSKPHPAVFELAAGRLGAEAGQCRVWEDSVNGVIAARAAGMAVIAVPDPDDPEPRQFSIADRVHASLHQSLAELQAE